MRLRELVLAVALVAPCAVAAADTPPAAVKVPLQKGWKELDAKGGPRAFQRTGRSGALQITAYARIPDGLPSNHRDLVADLRYFVKAAGFGGAYGEPLFTSGKCAFGRYAKAVIPGPEHKGEIVWMATDGTRSMLATYGWDETPTATEIEQADAIVRGVTLAK